MPLVPVGGITPESMAAYVAAGSAGFGLGSAIYKPGMTPTELAKLDQAVKAGLADHYIRHIEGSTLEIHPAPPTGGTANPQKEVNDEADRECAELLLGQEGTTVSQPGQLGGQDNSKEDTKAERVQGIAEWVGQGPLHYLAQAILLCNYGECSECPVITPDFLEQEEPLEAAQRMTAVVNLGIPVIADQVYDTIKMTKPEPGDQVVFEGRIGNLGDTGQPIDPNPQQPELPEEPGEEPVQSSYRRILRKASDSDIAELHELVRAAESAPHQNGEIKSVQRKLAEMARR